MLIPGRKDKAMNENTLKRYEAAIAKIGHPALLELPAGIKELLKGTRDLEEKTAILEAVAEALKK